MSFRGGRGEAANFGGDDDRGGGVGRGGRGSNFGGQSDGCSGRGGRGGGPPGRGGYNRDDNSFNDGGNRGSGGGFRGGRGGPPDGFSSSGGRGGRNDNYGNDRGSYGNDRGGGSFGRGGGGNFQGGGRSNDFGGDDRYASGGGGRASNFGGQDEGFNRGPPARGGYSLNNSFDDRGQFGGSRGGGRSNGYGQNDNYGDDRRFGGPGGLPNDKRHFGGQRDDYGAEEDRFSSGGRGGGGGSRGGFAGSGRGGYGRDDNSYNNGGSNRGSGGGFRGSRQGDFGTQDARYGGNDNYGDDRRSYGQQDGGSQYGGSQRGGRGGRDGDFGGRGGPPGGPRVCFNCNEEGHIGRDCPQPRENRGGGGGGPRVCYNCNEEGHIGRDCPQPRKERPMGGGGGGGGTCFNCNQEGHFSRECPNGPANGEQREIRRSFMPTNRDVDEVFAEDQGRQQSDQLYDLDGKVEVEGGPDAPCVFETWADSNFTPQILRNIERAGYARPRNFQRHAIPLILEGYDVEGQAETGSGKSAAFLLPIIQKLAERFEGTDPGERRNKVAALIVEPTRELARQLYEQALKFADKTGVTVNYAYGEYHMGENRRSLEQCGCDVLVGTTGRLKHLLTSGFINPTSLKFFVLDEADSLLAYSFMPDIEAMTNATGFPSKEERQTLFFSATFSRDIQAIAGSFCRPKPHCVLVRNQTDKRNQRIQHEVLLVPFDQRKQFLLKSLKEETDANGGVTPKKLIFVERRVDADTLAGLLCYSGITAQTVNGDRTQQQREEATRDFRAGKLRVLVVTNVFARGLDINDLGNVINVHLPSDGDRDIFVHRIGRTGRLTVGKATTYFDPDHPTDREGAQMIAEEMEKAGQEVPDFVRKVAEGGFYFNPNAYARPDAQPQAALDIAEPEF